MLRCVIRMLPLGLSKGMIVSIILLASLAFSINLWFAISLYHLNVLQQYDVLFNTDPGCRLASLAHGWCSDSRNIKHPNFANYFNPPIRIAGMLASPFLNEADTVHFRVLLALLVLPAAAALQTVLLFLTAGHLGFSRIQATLVSLLSIAAFAQLIYGSIPEHFGVTSCILAVAFYLMAKLVAEQRREMRFAWGALQVLAMGVTITNAAPLAMLHFITLLGLKRRFWPSVWRTGATAVIAVIITFTTALAFNRLYEAPEFQLNVPDFVKKNWAEDPLQRILEFPTALANTFVSPKPMVIENTAAIEHGYSIEISFTFENAPQVFIDERWLGALVLLLLMLGASALIVSGGLRRMVGVAALGVVLFNWGLHAIWGGELFLYAAHWLVPAIILMSGVFCLTKVRPLLINLPVAAFIAAIFFTNATIISYILATLEHVSS